MKLGVFSQGILGASTCVPAHSDRRGDSDQNRRARIYVVRPLAIGADDLIVRLLGLPAERGVCILDSCGVGAHGRNLLIAGVDPIEAVEIREDTGSAIERLEDITGRPATAAVFTLSYELGLGLNGINPRSKLDQAFNEPLVTASLFDALLVHDYDSGITTVAGSRKRSAELAGTISDAKPETIEPASGASTAVSNFTGPEYCDAVEAVRELIRRGETYQTNLTQQITVLSADRDAAKPTFAALRRDHPAQFAAYLQRGDSTVVSASPELFFRVEGDTILASPIKGTIRRGVSPAEDRMLRRALEESKKDRAENTMIVDLVRNDLGRVCDFGSVTVGRLCEIEEHPTLFHLVSDVSGQLRPGIGIGDIIRALFPCGSITGAPKIRTMQIIDQLETARRGLSMGAIGVSLPVGILGDKPLIETSVAIRTATFHDGRAAFNVGGGITIDSDPESEYEESWLKAKAILRGLGSKRTRTKAGNSPV